MDLPVINFVYKYIYHELPKAVDMLPFQAMGITNEIMKTGFWSSYKGSLQWIKYGFVQRKKKIINYDTRYFTMVKRKPNKNFPL